MNTKPNPWNNFNPPRLNPVIVYDVAPRKPQAAPPAPDNSLIHKHLPDPADRMLLAKWDALPVGVYHRSMFTDAEHRKVLVLLAMRDRLNAQAEEDRERARLHGVPTAQKAAPAPAAPAKKFRGDTPGIRAAKRYAHQMQCTAKFTAEQARRHVLAAIMKDNN
jgi:hypothetical protein